MITAEQIQDILSSYKRFGWTLRGVLLTKELSDSLSADLKDLLNNTETTVSNINAAWFSRPSKENMMAWELRHLSANPFAFFETFKVEPNPEQRRSMINKMETRLRKTSSKN